MAVKGVDSVRRALLVLEEIAAKQPVGVSAIARSLRLTKSSTQRVLVSLAAANWVCADGSDATRWVIAPHALSIAFAATSRDAYLSQLMPALDGMRDATSETAFVGIPDGSRTVLVEVRESDRPVRVVIRIGTVAAAQDSASGLAMAAFLDPAGQERLLGGPGEVVALADELIDVRRQGFAVAFGAVRNDIRTVAAPAFDAGGVPIAALGIAAPADRMTRKDALRIGNDAVEWIDRCGLGPRR